MTIAALPDLMMIPHIESALREDLGRGGDITSLYAVPSAARATVVMAAREDGVICGLQTARLAFHAVDATLDVTLHKQDGEKISKGDVVMTISGKAQSLLMGERVALNFVGHMSGIATMTAKMQAACAGTKAKICSTRKTLPNLRLFQKYAVRAGGGVNHRLGLDDAVMLKDNHIAIAGSIENAVASARAALGHTVKIEVEVDRLDQIPAALSAGADIILLDNMSPAQLADAVALIDGRALAEASGGVTLDAVPAIAASGVDMISVGFLTHSVKNFDVGLDYKGN